MAMNLQDRRAEWIDIARSAMACQVRTSQDRPLLPDWLSGFATQVADAVQREADKRFEARTTHNDKE